jgi:hypothetical protein
VAGSKEADNRNGSDRRGDYHRIDPEFSRLELVLKWPVGPVIPSKLAASLENSELDRRNNSGPLFPFPRESGQNGRFNFLSG